MDRKPSVLPTKNQVVGKLAPKRVTVGIGRGVGYVEYRMDILWQGYYTYSVSSPGQIGYKYKRQVYRRSVPNGTWTRITPPVWPTSGVSVGPTAETFFSPKSPQNLYGWSPPSGTGGGIYIRTPYDPKDPNQTPTDGAFTGSTDTVDSFTLNATFKNKKIYYNPPLHRYTKGHTPPFESAAQYQASTAKTNTRLGVIYTPETIRDDSKERAYSRRWGFRFLYNPTYWGYSLAVTDMTTPEQMLNSVGSLLPTEEGKAQWKLELYLNRIADLKKANQVRTLYDPDISQKQLNEIIKRGTEYDLDFLYRCINGDPKAIKTGSRVTNTANIGFLQYQRVGVRIASGAWFYGIINSIDVDHVMMTANMIPTLTRVNVGIAELIQPIKPGKAGRGDVNR